MTRFTNDNIDHLLRWYKINTLIILWYVWSSACACTMSTKRLSETCERLISFPFGSILFNKEKNPMFLLSCWRKQKIFATITFITNFWNLHEFMRQPIYVYMITNWRLANYFTWYILNFQIISIGMTSNTSDLMNHVIPTQLLLLNIKK